MAAIITLLIVIAFSMLVTKVATIALVHTGMSREVAQFQARSALSGAGFTTSASEKVVDHPVRRRIISVLILVGSAGLVTAISSLLLGFIQVGEDGHSTRNLLVLFAGVSLLLLATRSRLVDRGLSVAINRVLDRYTSIRVREFSKLISVSGDYEISEISCERNPWLVGRTIGETGLKDEGILVLGIYRDPGTYLGTPRGCYRIEEGDRLVVYGRHERIQDVSERGDDLLAAREAHADAKEEQASEQRDQDRRAEQGDSS